MSVETARAHLTQWGRQNDMIFFEQSSATVELAAQALGTQGCRIAKTLSFLLESAPILVVAAGDARIDNARYKAQFGQKAKMLTAEQVEAMTSHPVGGVCPFGLPENVKVYLDSSLQRFDIVYPACGSGNSAIPMTCTQLEEYTGGIWVDLCKGWRDEE